MLATPANSQRGRYQGWLAALHASGILLAVERERQEWFVGSWQLRCVRRVKESSVLLRWRNDVTVAIAVHSQTLHAAAQVNVRDDFDLECRLDPGSTKQCSCVGLGVVDKLRCACGYARGVDRRWSSRMPRSVGRRAGVNLVANGQQEMGQGQASGASRSGPG